MPYGISKEIGGDSPANVKWMEKCVSSISGTNKRTGKPYTKGEKIAICKKRLEQVRKKSAELELDFTLDAQLLKELDQKIFMYKQFYLNSGKAKNDREAEALVQDQLEKGEI
jgi:hypothetical protein